METVLYLCGFLLFIIFIVAIVRSEKEDVSPTEEAADKIMDELLQEESPEPPPADLFVREEDLIEVKEPVKVVEVELVAPDTTDGVYEMEMPVEEPTPEVVPEVKEEVKPVAEPVTYSEHPKKKKKHYPSKAKNKKS
jgi:hypothetical protein